MNQVEIITIGDELLIGQVVDTNSAWIARELNKIGFDVKYKTSVGDNEKDILNAFDRAFLRASVILVTGGIGPTKDDITKKTLCKYYDCGLRFDGNVLKNMETIFARLGRKINPLTYGQAYVPELCTVIQNETGTAPGMWFEKDGKILVSMPGVPFEMKWLMTNEVLVRLKQFLGQDMFIQHHTYLVEGYTESALAMYLEEFENNLPGNITLAYLPSAGFIRLRISGRDEDEKLLTGYMEEQHQKLSAALGENLLADEDKPIQLLLEGLLKENNLTISIAESCTGGNIAHLITSIPGSSQYFKGGIVAYSNEVKVNVLQVNAKDIDIHGAVSKEVVSQMAEGVAGLLKTDCAIATSGIAGPDGGTPEKPVGTVWIAVFYKGKIKSAMYSFGKSRENNIDRASNMALLMLYRMLKE